jgi:predicted XRE-type DNA-binding protein
MDKQDYWFITKHAKQIKAYDLLGGKCMVCGNDNIFQLVFHHKTGDEKEYSISRMFNEGKPWNLIEREVLKCDLMCSNCHMEHHYIGKGIKEKHNKKLMLEYLEIDQCEKCGYNNCHRALCFHHREPKTKAFTLSNALSCRVSELPELIKEELKKCVVLCTNCHIEEHINKEKFYKFKDKIYELSENMIIKPTVDWDLVISLHGNGMSYNQICKELGCAKSTVSYIVNKGR